MTISERRDAVRFLVERGLSPSRACQLARLARSTFHYQARPDRNVDLVEQLRELAAKHPRYGYRSLGYRSPLEFKRAWEQAQAKSDDSPIVT